MTNPSTGNIQDTSVPDAKAIQTFVSELNLAPKIDDRVRPYYPMNTQATINIRRGYVATTASSEGLVE